MMTTFSASRPSYGDTTQRNSNWNGDGSTLDLPGEDPEYGAGDPERVLELVPGNGFSNDHGRGKSWSEEEKKEWAQIYSLPEPHGPVHHATPSSESVDSLRH